MKKYLVLIILFLAHSSFALNCSVQVGQNQKSFSLEISKTIFDEGNGANRVIKKYGDKVQAQADLESIKESYVCSDDLVETFCTFGLDMKSKKIVIERDGYPINDYNQDEWSSAVADFELLNKNGICTDYYPRCTIYKDKTKTEKQILVIPSIGLRLSSRLNKDNTKYVANIKEADQIVKEARYCKK